MKQYPTGLKRGVRSWENFLRNRVHQGDIYATRLLGELKRSGIKRGLKSPSQSRDVIGIVLKRGHITSASYRRLVDILDETEILFQRGESCVEFEPDVRDWHPLSMRTNLGHIRSTHINGNG